MPENLGPSFAPFHPHHPVPNQDPSHAPPPLPDQNQDTTASQSQSNFGPSSSSSETVVVEDSGTVIRRRPACARPGIHSEWMTGQASTEGAAEGKSEGAAEGESELAT